jgi:single-stranded-DNA-specific exonuclease
MSSMRVHPIILKILEKRGISQNEIEQFFSWELKALPEITNLIDLPKAVNRIYEAISLNQKIGVYGDYDVDGTTSCALLYHFFKMIGVEIEVIQPSRFIEGYGIHNSSIDFALSKNIQVLITVDCGITSIETAEYAQGKLDLIITDHHQDAREKIPEAFAVINPNRRDEPSDSPLKTLAGVGVAFALALALRNKLISYDPSVPSIYPLLQFVAIGTICDMAHLDSMNLKLCRHGLKQLANTQFKGLKAFLSPEEYNLPFIESEKISFQIGPMINSKGRIEHPEIAFRLLVSETEAEAREFYSNLNQSNAERKFIQKNVFEEAKSLLLKEMKSDDLPVAILYSDNFHEGVIGIVASKIVETFNIPAIIFTKTEDKNIIKASARSCGELNIFELLKANEKYFTKFGGHKAAAGLSMNKENLINFKNDFMKLIKQIPPIMRKIIIYSI